MRLSDARRILSEQEGITLSPAGRIIAHVQLGVRKHQVRIRDAEGWIRVEGRIAQLSEVEQRPLVRELAANLLEINHSTELATLVRDTESDSIFARYDIPPESVPQDLLAAVWHVARLADRWELLWTGNDSF